MKSRKGSNKELNPWRTQSSEVILEDRWLTVRADECITEDGTVISPYYVLEYPDWVHMIVVNDKDQILITQQYRHGTGTVGFEIPCGTVEEDEKSLVAAKRELLEETGYSGEFVLLGKISPNAATHANSIYAFIVTKPEKIRDPIDDPTEVLTFEFLDLGRVFDLIKSGQFPQAVQMGGLLLALRKMGRISRPGLSKEYMVI